MNNIESIVRDLRRKGYNVKYRDSSKTSLNITIIGFNAIIDDTFYMNRMIKGFPSIYYSINRKVIDDIKSEIYIDEKMVLNNNSVSQINYWIDCLPTIDVRSFINNIIEEEDINL